MDEQRIKPGLAYRFLTPFYDAVSGILGFGAPFMRRVLQSVDIRGDETVLDVGRGTGTLIIEVKKRFPNLDIVGMDADQDMLWRAARKLQIAGIKAHLVHGYAQKIPFPDAYFDLAFSTLIFHHLSTEVKKQALREIYRVLKADGQFLLADFGKPETFLARFLLNIGSIFDGRRNMKLNLQGLLPGLLREAGFRVDELRPRYHGVQFLLAKK